MPTHPIPDVIDGATATELARHGIPIEAPYWTSAALTTESRRAVLRELHGDYLATGAGLITANTFRCNERALRSAGLDVAGPAWLVHAAVGVALAARNRSRSPGALIAGSLAPVEDCYRPDLVPSDDELVDEHRVLATELVRAGVDLVLVETMNTVREARIALDQVRRAGGRAWVGFVCADDGRLLSGESVVDAARAVSDDGAEVVLVNCTPLRATERALRDLREHHTGPIGAYPNAEGRDRAAGGDPGPAGVVGPDAFAETLQRWRDDLAVDVLGGCCGAGPAHIAALCERRMPAVAG